MRAVGVEDDPDGTGTVPTRFRLERVGGTKAGEVGGVGVEGVGREREEGLTLERSFRRMVRRL